LRAGWLEDSEGRRATFAGTRREGRAVEGSGPVGHRRRGWEM